MPNGAPRYSMRYKGVEIMPAGFLGMRFESQPAFDDGFRVADARSSSHDETWEQPWGERRYVRDHHNELLVQFESATTAARASSTCACACSTTASAFATRCRRSPATAPVNITDELTEFRLDPAARRPPPGGSRAAVTTATSTSTRHTPLAAIQMAHTPMTVRLPSGLHLSFHEAALVDYTAYVIDQRRDGVFKTNLTPWSDGIRVKTQHARSRHRGARCRSRRMPSG